MTSADEDFARNSRLILAVGAEAHQRIRKFKVGVVGLTPTGTEIAKNLLLTGAGTVELRDSQNVTNFDLGSNLFLRPKDIGKSRLDVLTKRLASLNPHSVLHGSAEAVTEDWIAGLDSLIIAELRPFSELTRISHFCHEKKIQFIFAATIGTCSVLFEDFGENFVCENLSGLEQKRAPVVEVTNGTKPLVSIDPAFMDVNFAVGSTVKFEGIEGMPFLNGKTAAVTVKGKSGHAYRIDLNNKDEAPFDRSQSRGWMIEVLEQKEFAHKAIDDALGNTISNMGWGTDHYPKIRDLVIEVCKFLDQEKRLPGVLNQADSEKVASKVEMDHDLARKIVMCTGTEYPPNVGVVGGAAAQEAMKFCSRTFKPSEEQWFVVAHTVVMTWKEPPVLHGDRYDSIVCSIGNELAEKLRKSSALLIGVGAIGCEYARYLALFGFEKVMMIDNDTVEPSNLTRQFLFREKHKHMSKAEVGRRAILKANPDLKPENIVASTSYFDGKMLSQLPFDFDIVFSAVDSVSSRRFIFNYCWLYDIPMVNGGMTQARGDFQCYVPFRTIPFRMSEVTGESIPSCTLKNFPTKPIHIVQFVHNEFLRLFKTIPESSLQCIANLPKADITCLKDGASLLCHLPKTFADCVQWAYSQFVRIMEIKPQMMLKLHPEGSVDRNGLLYWSTHIKPRVLPFDPTDRLHLQFVASAASLKAKVHGIEVTEADLQNIGEVLKTCKKPEPSVKEQIVDGTKIRGQIEAIEGLASIHVTPIDFDKDDVLHMDFIEAYAITRGLQTGIPMTHLNRLELMKMVGKIAPTMATTTAMVGGGALGPLPTVFDKSFEGEQLPVMGECSLIGLQYRVGYSAIPGKSRKIPNTTEKFCVWDCVDIRGNPLLTEMSEKYDSSYEGGFVMWYVGETGMLDPMPDVHVNEALKESYGYEAGRYFVTRVLELDDGKSVFLPPFRVITQE